MSQKIPFMSTQQDRGLVELPDRWLLPYRGMKVTRVLVDYALTLLLKGQAEIVIESPATLADRLGRAPGAQTAELHPCRQDVATALRLFGTTVNSGVAFKTGVLRLVLDHYQVSVRPDPDYEAWNVVGPDKCAWSACLAANSQSGSNGCAPDPCRTSSH
jgi:hypothetical protein